MQLAWFAARPADTATSRGQYPYGSLFDGEYAVARVVRAFEEESWQWAMFAIAPGQMRSVIGTARTKEAAKVAAENAYLMFCRRLGAREWHQRHRALLAAHESRRTGEDIQEILDAPD